MTQESVGSVHLRTSDLDKLLYGGSPSTENAPEESSDSLSEAELQLLVEKTLSAMSLEELYKLRESSFVDESGQEVVNLELFIPGRKEKQKTRINTEYSNALKEISQFNAKMQAEIENEDTEFASLQDNFDLLLQRASSLSGGASS